LSLFVSLFIKENNGLINLKAPLASPALSGTPTAPTAEAGTINTQIATTEFVTAAASASKFVDLNADQNIEGIKSFDSNILVSGITVGGSRGMMGMEPNNAVLGYNATTVDFSEESTAIGNLASASGPQSFKPIKPNLLFLPDP
jgi:hypothetical protein